MRKRNPQAPQPHRQTIPTDQPGTGDASREPASGNKFSRRQVLGFGLAGAGVVAVGGVGGYVVKLKTDTHSLTARTAAWKAGGTYEFVNGHRIFVRRTGGNGPLVVILHGFPTNSYDWREVIPSIKATGASVLAFDFLGFGLSDKPTDIVYSLKTQADIVEHLIGRQAALIVAHDMGDSVATELMARDLEGKLRFSMDGVLFLNSSVTISKAHPTIVQKLLRSPVGPLIADVNSESLFKKSLGGVFSADHPLTAQEADDQWSLSTYNNGHELIDKLSYFNTERVEQARRWEGAIHNWRGRLDIGWGSQDKIPGEPVLKALTALHPAATVNRWPSLGHYPHIEDPASVSTLATQFISARP